MESISLPTSRRAAVHSVHRIASIFLHAWSKRPPVPAVLVPSFLHRNAASSSSKVAPTAWLDGMRGLAAFFVYIRHFSAITHPDIQPGFGSSDSNRWIIQLPFLRLLISGPSMVALFFIISGYALSWGPLRALHMNNSSEQALNRLSSAIFRRATRLFLPGIVSTFAIMVCISLGMYDRGQRAFESSDDMPGFHEPQPPQFRKDPFSVQFWDWVRSTWQWLNIWGVSGHPYNPHLWTLSVEFRCSIALFVVLIGLARTKAAWRLAGLGAMVIYCYYTNAWSEWMFFAGGFLAQVRLLQEERKERRAYEAASPSVSSEKTLPLTDDNGSKGGSVGDVPDVDTGRYVLFIIGLYLLSNPDGGHAGNAPGYIVLSRLAPSGWPENWRFWHCVGGAFVVYATSSTTSNYLRSIFDNPLSLYLGRISYALYLVHGPIVHMLGFWLVPAMWTITGKEGMLGKETGFGIAFIIITGLVVWTADIFWRCIDVRCVALGKWIENAVIENS